MNQQRSAGAVVVTGDAAQPLTLLLDQVRSTGERQTVAPKGRIEPAESPLAAAIREVGEEAGITQMDYVGYLGQQAYSYTGDDGTTGTKTVDWFLLSRPDRSVAPRAAEGFVAASWVPFGDAHDAITHPTFGAYLRRAADLIAWRSEALPLHSPTLSALVRGIGDAAAEILTDTPSAGLGLCGSGARGDFVDGWSDVDLVGWGLPPDSRNAVRLWDLAAGLARRTGMATSIRLADTDGRDATGAGALYDMKLQAVLRRRTLHLAVVAGAEPPLLEPPADRRRDVTASLAQLHHFAATQLAASDPAAEPDTAEARPVLSAASSAGRLAATAVDPETCLRLPVVAATLNRQWPDNLLSGLLTDYDAFRRYGAPEATAAWHLASRVPNAIEELHRVVAHPGGPVSTPRSMTEPP